MGIFRSKHGGTIELTRKMEPFGRSEEAAGLCWSVMKHVHEDFVS